MPNINAYPSAPPFAAKPLLLIPILATFISIVKSAINPHFQTTLSDIETSQWVIGLTNPAPVSGFVTESHTLNYINAYTTGTPSVSLSIDYMEGSYPSTTSYTETAFDLSITNTGGSSVTIQLNRTQNFIATLAINYVVVKNNFFIDIKKSGIYGL